MWCLVIVLQSLPDLLESLPPPLQYLRTADLGKSRKKIRHRSAGTVCRGHHGEASTKAAGVDRKGESRRFNCLTAQHLASDHDFPVQKSHICEVVMEIGY